MAKKATNKKDGNTIRNFQEREMDMFAGVLDKRCKLK